MEKELKLFVEKVWKTPSRDLPWRHADTDGFDPYKILVSEIMLQQTQVNRVTDKYLEFLHVFPTVTALSTAPLSAVLILWSGLGYNRRAKFLHEAAKEIATSYKGKVPDSVDELVSLPGVGRNTAAAIITYSFNKPAPFVETNIRTVYLHHFFQEDNQVSDKDILALVEESLNFIEGRCREFFWALMDYGTLLKQSGVRNIHQSKSYVKQSKFEGSLRQVRGQVIRLLAEAPKTSNELGQVIVDKRLKEVIESLVQEGLITRSKGLYRLP